MQQPPYVIECPECGEKYLISTDANVPSINATLYSDGYYIDKENWRTPAIIGCATCELGFFPETGKVIAEPDWQTYYELWSHIPKAQPPTAGALAIELRIRKKIDLEVEKKIRQEFWYAGNHTETGRLLRTNNHKFNEFWLQNMQILESILSNDLLDELILKAEINRQLGNFSTCLKMIEGQNNRLMERIKDYAQSGNSQVFTL